MNKLKQFIKWFDDPKFGYHWVWIVPVFYTLMVSEKLFDIAVSIVDNLKLRWLLFRNPELKTLRKLSGQDK